MQFESTLRDAAVRHSHADFAKMHAIARHLHDNPAEKDVFAQDPEGFAFRFNGYRVQDGHHLHVADEHNNLIPAETYGVFGSDDRPQWGRSEIRVGYKTTALVECC
ncbi:MAG: hypothetical protein LCH61_16695 [Proteobacteria bacterium]|nr:hypothetical protein [Pseudomonadota bacterium]